MKKNLSLLFTLLFFVSVNGQNKSIDSLTKEMIESKGVINTFSKNNKLYFEISDDLLSKEILVVTRLAQIPSGYSAYINAGSKTSEQVIDFQKKNNNIYVRQLSYQNIANENDPIGQSVQENNFPPILASFEIQNTDKGSYLINVSDYFLNDSP